MSQYSQHWVRTWVVLGFFLTAIGWMWIFLREVTGHLSLQAGFWSGLESTVVPVMALVSLYASSRLTKCRSKERRNSP